MVDRYIKMVEGRIDPARPTQPYRICRRRERKRHETNPKRDQGFSETLINQ
jgi:hypothetical protein